MITLLFIEYSGIVKPLLLGGLSITIFNTVLGLIRQDPNLARRVIINLFVSFSAALRHKSRTDLLKTKPTALLNDTSHRDSTVVNGTTVTVHYAVVRVTG